MLEAVIHSWVPQLKLQFPNVISGVTGVSSLINISGSIADLILLPLAMSRKKDGRVIHGFQQGVTSFAKTTTMETIKMGSKVAAGTQVLLEQADDILSGESRSSGSKSRNTSKFSEQPKDLSQGK